MNSFTISHNKVFVAIPKRQDSSFIVLFDVKKQFLTFVIRSDFNFFSLPKLI